jgi:hypothetical protein
MLDDLPVFETENVKPDLWPKEIIVGVSEDQDTIFADFTTIVCIGVL